MGKRSDIPRIPQDKYDSPYSAVRPLLRHLAAETEFFEPCAGAGKLIGHLEANGHYCVGAIDIEPRAPQIVRGDVLKLKGYRDGTPTGVHWITNPPWKRAVLHAVIQKAMEIGVPTWLLIDAPWAFTHQAGPFMGLYCKKVVTVGRVCWFPETKKTGKDDCCWYLFTPEPGPTIFYGHQGGI